MDIDGGILNILRECKDLKNSVDGLDIDLKFKNQLLSYTTDTIQSLNEIYETEGIIFVNLLSRARN